jgi:PAS domain S-box-containing protein
MVEKNGSCCSKGLGAVYAHDTSYAPIFDSDFSLEDINKARSFFNLVNSPIIVLDAAANILLVNHNFESIFGHSEVQIKNGEWMGILSSSGISSSFQDILSGILSDDIDFSNPLEHEIIGDDGEKRVISWSVTLLKDKDEVIKGLILSGADITAKDAFEKQVLSEKQGIFSFLDSATYAVVLSDSAGNITFWNKKASHLFGYTKDEIIGKPLTFMMPKRYRKAHEGWDCLISIGKSAVVGRIFEAIGLRKDGTEFPLEISISTTRSNGEMFHSAILNDISKRKMKERMMTISKNKYRMIFEKSPLGIFHFDENGVITQCNEKFVNIMEADEERVISSIMGFNLLSLKEDSIKSAVKRVLTGISARYEDTFISPFSEKEIPIKAEFSPVISDEGKFMGGVCVVEDFTERKAAEKALNQYAEDLAKANEELTSLDRMKDEFLSNLRHELKTPLIPIKGYSELMFDGALGELTEKQRDAMEKVMLSSDRLKRLIDSLLYVSITEAGNVEYSFVPLRLSEVINSAIHNRSPELTSKNHKVNKQFPDDLPLIEGDLDYLEEAFINIIDNASKFTPTNGTISISAIREEDKIHLRITDNGAGIPEDSLSQIFDRFYQVDGSSTRRYGGNGLGLYICKKVIESHNGSIWAESKEGVFTTIHVILPVKELSSAAT